MDSVKYYSKTVAVDPKAARSWEGLGFAALESQKFSDSIHAFEKLCELDATDGARKVRKAGRQVRGLKLPEWDAKFQHLIDKCDSKGKER
ncbi:MAG: hypothetical protein C5B49_01290 [Bdellovibrio sp.]|nr:MAG: hypothetical protein C5B49_01290 [Bdellovibrio sp.]